MHRAQMRAYAIAQVIAMRKILTAHRTDGAGCCTNCGRPTPCPDRVGAETLHERYTTWLTTAAAPVNGHVYRQSIRPHLRNTARR